MSMHRFRGAAVRETVAGYAFVSPVILGLLIWTAVPMAMSLFYSFTHYDIVNAPQVVGGDNYGALLADSSFHNALFVTILYSVISVPLNMAAGLLIALLLNERVFGMRLFRSLIYLPSIVPFVATAVLWKWMFSSSQYGIVNSILLSIHVIGKPFTFFDAPPTALFSVIMMNLWSAGGSMLIWLAGLKSVPEELYEAAKMDGARLGSRFVHITLPIISPTILFNLVLGFIGSMQLFTQAYVISGGASGYPLGALDLLNIFIFRHAFQYFQMGYASAAAWILFAITLVVTLLFFRMTRGWVFYAGERG